MSYTPVTEPEAHVIQVTSLELLVSVRSLLLGLASRLYTWDSNMRVFRLESVSADRPSRLEVSGLDHVVRTTTMSQ